MAQFKFKEGLILDFGSVQFEVRPDDPDFLEQLENARTTWGETFHRLNTTGTEVNADLIRATCNGVAASIESILGEGTVAEIFGNRPLSFSDLVDVVVYIGNEVDGYWKRIESDYATQTAQNREQRRALKPAVKKIAALPANDSNEL